MSYPNEVETWLDTNGTTLAGSIGAILVIVLLFWMTHKIVIALSWIGSMFMTSLLYGIVLMGLVAVIWGLGGSVLFDTLGDSSSDAADELPPVWKSKGPQPNPLLHGLNFAQSAWQGKISSPTVFGLGGYMIQGIYHITTTSLSFALHKTTNRVLPLFYNILNLL